MSPLTRTNRAYSSLDHKLLLSHYSHAQEQRHEGLLFRTRPIARHGLIHFCTQNDPIVLAQPVKDQGKHFSSRPFFGDVSSIGERASKPSLSLAGLRLRQHKDVDSAPQAWTNGHVLAGHHCRLELRLCPSQRLISRSLPGFPVLRLYY